MKILLPISDRYKPPLRAGFIWMAVLGVFSALALDMGQLIAVWRYAAAVFLATGSLILARRPVTPTAVDLLVLTWGFPVLYLSTQLVYPLVWH